MNAIPADRWFAAQEAEREFWNAHDRREHELQQRFIMTVLAIGSGPAPRAVLDFGGGPSSLLLHMGFMKTKHVVDPLPLTEDETKRYDGAGITYHRTMAENFEAAPGMFDEVWGYNCLQHVQVPGQILERARSMQPKKIRWFEWTDVPVSIVHPHMIEAKWLIHELLRNQDYVQEFCTIGTHETPDYRQNFVAMVVTRNVR